MRLDWDRIGERVYETGVDQGVLYVRGVDGAYDDGVAWNGLTTVTESPSGAESNKQYADNQVYVNLVSAEQFGGTIEAFTYPDEFAVCDGTAAPTTGVAIGQQGRRAFGLCYRTLVGNDTEETDYGYKIHLVYGAQAAPSEKAHTTVNDSPEAIGFSWSISTTPVTVAGTNPDTGKPYRPTATLTIDSTKVDTASLAELEDILYGSAGADARLPMPGEILALFSGTETVVTTVPPTYDAATDIVTIPAVVGVDYQVDGATVPSGPYGPITGDIVVTAVPTAGHVFSDTSDDDWTIVHS